MILTKIKAQIKNLWLAYWFPPAPSIDLGISRVIIVSALLINLIVGDYVNRIINVSSLPDYVYTPPLSVVNFFWFKLGFNFRPSLLVLLILFGISILTGITSLIGLRTNLSLLIFAIGNIIIRIYCYSFGRIAHPDSVMVAILFILVLSPAGCVLSVDDIRRRIKLNLRNRKLRDINILNEKSRFVKWPLLLAQWIISISYLDAFVSKINPSSNVISLDWLNGYTLQYYLSGLTESKGWFDVGYLLAHNNTLASLASWVSILFEGTFFLVLFFPRLVWLYLPLGLTFHLGIFLTMKITFFMMLFTYASFISWHLVIKLLHRTLPGFNIAEKLAIFYDSSSPKCLRLVTIIFYFDWFNKFRYFDTEKHCNNFQKSHPEIYSEDYHQKIYVSLPKGKIEKGVTSLSSILKILLFGKVDGSVAQN
ncbi:MAG: hypothetical protein RLZZ148_2120 [Cyanobacteriota bacterium]|jgi:hypothetical protein